MTSDAGQGGWPGSESDTWLLTWDSSPAPTTLWWSDYFPHFTDEETEAREVKNAVLVNFPRHHHPVE